MFSTSINLHVMKCPRMVSKKCSRPFPILSVRLSGIAASSGRSLGMILTNVFDKTRLSRPIPPDESDMSSKQRVGDTLDHIKVLMQEAACGGLLTTALNV